MRVFIAIDFTNEIKEQLVEIQRYLKNGSKKGSFTHKENFHVTLKFIGDVTPEQLQSIKNTVGIVAQQNDPFELAFSNIGSFPRGNKSIQWIGLEHSSALHHVQSQLEDELEKYGFAKENRPYKPHITFGREVVMETSIQSLQLPTIIDKIYVDSLVVMESTRVNGKLTYSPIHYSSLT
ncbi:2'-5' RNA ligase [Desulfuribacillus stibiiarsenatis]|uniref:RNA 2',3'-cyclic phosphodiesterase n=1 Tax=Desulfuribacillus stibiiarsenatis TaxID=1390249 RepID=A0A1E5L7R6_9FIRM|nr:RNA 2',3'-cyclic phosphodiesterase [Desulfuribacillus stibiiarsenatis]OEH85993.1 2'-5' RNA ligase [Desulfuribacillus stibiiarsenatis]